MHCDLRAGHFTHLQYVMDGSSNSQYHNKYRSLEDDEETKATKPTRRRKAVLIALVIVAAIVILVVAVIAIIAIIGIVSGTRSTSCSYNQNAFNSANGKYNESGVGGITFISVIDASSVSLSITTQIGTLVVYLLHSTKTSMTMVIAENENFLVLESELDNKHNFAEYLIPKNSTEMVESMINNGEKMTDDVLQHMDNKTVDKVRQSSLQKLAMSNVATLIINAVTCTGGSQSPAAEVFTTFALQLKNARASSSQCDASCPDTPVFCRSHDQCCKDYGYLTFTCFSATWIWPYSLCSDTFTC